MAKKNAKATGSNVEMHQTESGMSFIAISDPLVVTGLQSTEMVKLPTSVNKNEDITTATNYVTAGQNDNFPNKLIEAFEKDTVLTPTVRLAATLLYGGGIAIGQYQYVNNKRDWQPYNYPPFWKWAKATALNMQLFTILYDYCYFAIAYPMLTLSLDGKTIARVSTKNSRSKACRLGRKKANGEYDEVFINPDFGTSYFNKELTKSLKVIPEFAGAEWLKKNAKPGASYIFPIRRIDSGREYYPMPDGYSAISSGWVEIASLIAIYNKAVLKSGATFKWHIEVHPDYWPSRFGLKWEQSSPTEKVEMMKEQVNEWKKALFGAENADAVIATAMKHVPGKNEETYSLVKITKLDNSTNGKDGSYLNASREASQHKIIAMGMDPTLVGALPGDGGMGAGSGSNNRVAFNQRVLLSKADQDNVLQLMELIRDFNEWPETMEFAIDQGLITTLDAGAEAAVTKK